MGRIEDKIMSNVSTGSVTVQTDTAILKQEHEQPFSERHRDILVELCMWRNPQRKAEINVAQYENFKFRRDKNGVLGDVTEAITIDPHFVEELIEILRCFKKRYLEFKLSKQGEKENAKSNECKYCYKNKVK
jgi:hypothetical protein